MPSSGEDGGEDMGATGEVAQGGGETHGGDGGEMEEGGLHAAMEMVEGFVICSDQGVLHLRMGIPEWRLLAV